MTNDNKPANDPQSVLDNLGVALRARSHVDAGLADILASNLLTATPAKDAVETAYQAILKLADARANDPKVAS